MITIHKYVVAPVLELPKGAHILDLQVQHDLATIWALVDTHQPLDIRKFHVVGTGESLPADTSVDGYIGTWQKGRFVWHLFEAHR